MKIKLHHALLITKKSVLNSFKYMYIVLIRKSLLKNIENGFHLCICKNIIKPSKILKSRTGLSG